MKSPSTQEVITRNLAIKPLLDPVTLTKTKSDFFQDAVYKTFTAGDLKGIAGRKWRYREGTLAEEKDRRDEEKEAEEFPTQVRCLVAWKLKIHES